MAWMASRPSFEPAVPPTLASFMPPVSGLFPPTESLFALGADDPARNPGATMKGLLLKEDGREVKHVGQISIDDGPATQHVSRSFRPREGSHALSMPIRHVDFDEIHGSTSRNFTDDLDILPPKRSWNKPPPSI